MVCVDISLTCEACVCTTKTENMTLGEAVQSCGGVEVKGRDRYLSTSGQLG